jgi:hypothetical protein
MVLALGHGGQHTVVHVNGQTAAKHVLNRGQMSLTEFMLPTAQAQARSQGYRCSGSTHSVVAIAEATEHKQ